MGRHKMCLCQKETGIEKLRTQKDGVMESAPGDWKEWDPTQWEVVLDFRIEKPLPLGWQEIKESDGHIHGIMNRLPQISHMREQVDRL